MATIEGSKLGLIQAFDDGENRRFDEADVRVRITIADLERAAIVLWLKLLDVIGARRDVVEQGDEHAGSQPLSDPVVDLDENRSRNHESLVRSFDQLAAPRVIGIPPVQ